MSRALNAAFFGEPYKMVVKSPDGVAEEFFFEQLGVLDLFEFQEALDCFIKAEALEIKGEKSEDDIKKLIGLNKEGSKLCVPLVRKMVDLSYPGTPEKDIDRFINANFMWLKTALILTNTQTLASQANAEISVKDFVESERRKLNDQPVDSSKAESTNGTA